MGWFWGASHLRKWFPMPRKCFLDFDKIFFFLAAKIFFSLPKIFSLTARKNSCAMKKKYLVARKKKRFVTRSRKHFFIQKKDLWVFQWTRFERKLLNRYGYFALYQREEPGLGDCKSFLQPDVNGPCQISSRLQNIARRNQYPGDCFRICMGGESLVSPSLARGQDRSRPVSKHKLRKTGASRVAGVGWRWRCSGWKWGVRIRRGRRDAPRGLPNAICNFVRLYLQTIQIALRIPRDFFHFWTTLSKGPVTLLGLSHRISVFQGF